MTLPEPSCSHSIYEARLLNFAAAQFSIPDSPSLLLLDTNSSDSAFFLLQPTSPSFPVSLSASKLHFATLHAASINLTRLFTPGRTTPSLPDFHIRLLLPFPHIPTSLIPNSSYAALPLNLSPFQNIDYYTTITYSQLLQSL